jgi:pilus assembly protein FimV
MPIPRPLLKSLILSLASLMAAAAAAAGIGAASTGAVMGQPLDFAVQVRLEPDVALEPRCVSAEVTAGERRLPPPLVNTVVEMIGVNLARVRVLTRQAVEEPVLGIDLIVGCQAPMSRRFVVLADPPLITPMAALAPAAADTLAGAPGVPGSAPASLAAPLPEAAADVPRASGSVVKPTAPAKGRAQRKASVRTAKAAGPQAERNAARARTAKARPRAEPARLRLDMLEHAADPQSQAVEEALEAVAQAASATRAAASAASASATRIASLEQTVTQLRSENQARSDLVLQLRERLALVDSTNIWLLPLLLLAGALAALAAWLAWRLAALQRMQQQAWRGAPAPRTEVGTTEAPASRPPTSPAPFVTAKKLAASGSAGEKPRAVPAWPPAAPVTVTPEWASMAGPPTQPESRDHVRTQVLPGLQIGTAGRAPAAGTGRPDPGAAASLERTDVLPPRVQTDLGAPRDVSIEELIDLEQQAEFFVVLGQDEAAVDLLVEHLRTTGGGSPLPYLKLLEIHHRLGDRAAYERTRTRFNHRFNAFAPEWGADLHGGRSLEDYPGVVPRLQQVWSRPLDAMAELEALLFRKSRGELFELPAYREVLFLYSLARDLMDREVTDTGSVDLLLPLSDGGEFGNTSPAPFTRLQGTANEPPAADFDSRPTAPVDFDISAAEREASIFGTLDEQPQPLRPRF